jgi:hypothetical protein
MRLLGRIGSGLLAGITGTAIMTLGQWIEMRVTGREASDTPARIAEKLTGYEPASEAGMWRLNRATHWGYGALWGLVPVALRRLGLRGPALTAAHSGLMWLVALALLPGMKVAPPLRRWGARAIATDLLHHAVYGLGASLTLGLLARRAPEPIATTARQARRAMEPARV